MAFTSEDLTVADATQERDRAARVVAFWDNAIAGMLASSPTGPPVETYRVLAPKLNIRRLANPSSEDLGDLRKGDVVRVDQIMIAYGYTWGRLADRRGWAAIEKFGDGLYMELVSDIGT